MTPTKEELCDKILSIYPDIGSCDINVDVRWDEDSRSWIVNLKKDDQTLTTHLEPDDARNCMEGKECVHLGLQVAQLKNNIERRPT
jgi:hypothetical protein